jgi:hypothetical protein
VWQPFTGLSQQVGDVTPRFDSAAAAGLEDAQGGGVGRRALLGAGAVGDPPGDDGIAQRPFGLIVGGRQLGVGNEGSDRGPVVEDLAGQRPDLLGFIVAVELAGALQPGEDRVDDACAGALGHLVDQRPDLAQEPVAEIDADRVEPTSERDPFPQQMRQAALPLRELAVGPIAVADQPTQESVTD